MDSCTDPNLSLEARRRNLAAARRRIAGSRQWSANQAIFHARVRAAADELEIRLGRGAGGDLGAEVLWTLVSLAPALLEPSPRPDVAAELFPHPEVLDGREAAQRLRGWVAAFDAAGAAAKWCRLLELMFETVEHLTLFGHPGGHSEVVAECFEVLGAGAAFLESTTARAGR